MSDNAGKKERRKDVENNKIILQLVRFLESQNLITPSERMKANELLWRKL